MASPYSPEEEKAIANRYGGAAKALYLAALEETGAPWLALKMSGLKKSVVERWKEEDPDFVEEIEMTLQTKVDGAEIELRRRGVEGWEEPVGWYQGMPGGYVKKFSDTALLAYLKANRPEKYRENLNVTGQMQGFIDFSKLSNEQLGRIRAGENALAVLGMEALKKKALPAEVVEEDTDE